MSIEIFRGHADNIRRAAAAALPDECCGLLLGLDNRVLDIVPSANVAAEPARRFEVDPVVLVATHRLARERGVQLLGCYHSHPGGALAPSAIDAAQAIENMSLWLLASPTELTAWRWRRIGGFVAMDLVVVG